MTDELTASATAPAVLAAKQTKRARRASMALIAEIVFNAASILSNAGQLWVLEQIAKQAPDMVALAESNDLRQRIFAVFQLVGFVVAAVLFLIWLRGAYQVLVSAGRSSARFTPGWAVGYWFIPFINIVRPFHIVKELILRSRGAGDPEVHGPAPKVVTVWWSTYLISGLFGMVSGRLASGIGGLRDFTSATWMAILSDILLVVAGVCLLRIIDEVQRLQAALAAPQPSPAPLLSPEATPSPAALPTTDQS